MYTDEHTHTHTQLLQVTGLVTINKTKQNTRKAIIHQLDAEASRNLKDNGFPQGMRGFQQKPFYRLVGNQEYFCTSFF